MILNRIAAFSLTCVYFFTFLYSKELIPANSVQDTQPSFYTRADGRLYSPRHGSYTISVSAPFPINGIERTLSRNLGGLLQLKEGLNSLCQNEFIDEAAKNSHQEVQCFELWADGTGPVTKSQYTGTKLFADKKHLFYGKGLKLSFDASDSGAGVRNTWIAFDRNSFVQSTSVEFDFKNDRFHHIQYFSVDNVGNRETVRTDTFFTDITPPVTEITILGDFYNSYLSKAAVISLSGSDSTSGVAETFYIINKGEPVRYGSMIPFEKCGTTSFKLDFYSVDNTGNYEDVRTQYFTYDSAAPDISVEFSGALYETKGVYFTNSATEIILKSSDSASGVAAVYYSTDTSAEQKYTAPFTLPHHSGLHTISYRSIDNVKNMSLSEEQRIYLDITPPETYTKITKQSITQNDTIVISATTGVALVAADPESGIRKTFFSVNNSSDSLYHDTLFFLKDGCYFLTWHSIDNVNNSEQPRSAVIKVDNSIKQAISLSQGPEIKGWYSSDSTGLIGSNRLPFYLRIATSKDNSGQSFLLDVPPEDPLYFADHGMNSFKIKVTSHTRTYKLPIDTMAPMSICTFTKAFMFTDKDNTFFGKGLIVVLKANENTGKFRSGLNGIRYSVNGSEYASYAKPLEIFSREQKFMLNYYSVDNAGNMEQMHSTSFFVDCSAPFTELSISNAHLGRIVSASTEITLSSRDNLCGVRSIYYFFDSSNVKVYKTPLTGKDFLGMSDGEHVLHYCAEDHVGNLEKEKTFAIAVDHGKPVMSMRIIGSSYQIPSLTYITSESRIQLGASAHSTKIDKIHYDINSGAVLEYTAPFHFGNNEGTYILRYGCIDVVGNSSGIENRTFFIDNTSPITDFAFEGLVTVIDNNQYINSSTNIVLTSKDNASGTGSVYVKLNGGAYTTYAKPFRISTSGIYDCSFYAVDKVNNSEPVHKRSFVVDSKAPQIRITSNAQSRTSADSPAKIIETTDLIYINASDDGTGVKSILYSLNGAEKKVYRHPLTNFEKGKKAEITATADDKTGNVSTVSIKYIVK